MITQIVIGYDWENGSNYAKISLINNEGVTSSLLISGLDEYQISDDFSSAYFERCKLLISEKRIFLCFEPYDEFNEQEDLDNDYFWFRGRSIEWV